MKHLRRLVYALLILQGLSSCGDRTRESATNYSSQTSDVVRLFHGNPRYIEYKGKPTLLITSAEHYGALVNLDFDFSTYLQTLSEEGFNYTRIFTGTYIESEDNIFGIQKNTLGPKTDRYIAPWLMTDGKYDLDMFNPAFFRRIKDFVEQAAKLGIIVEITLFSSIYANNSWELMPFHPDNNVNQTEVLNYHRVNTLYNGKLKTYQEKFIRKTVKELNEYGNLFYEIQNEPWSDNANLVSYINEDDDEVFSRPWQKKVEIANGVSMEWQKWVTEVIRDEEKSLENQHLIAQNISNFQHNLICMPQDISLINFHYALPGAAQKNLDLGGVIGLDETGFMPQKDEVYINQAWRFVLSGGGLYNNLDYSFTAEHETGTWPIGESNPGWGGPQFRKKLSYLVEAMEDIPFYAMKPSQSVFRALEGELIHYALEKEGEVYLVFIEDAGDDDLIPVIPGGTYKCTWLHVKTGERKTEHLDLDEHTSLSSPFKDTDVVILIEKVN